MSKILLFGATGHLGKEIASELKLQGFNFTVVVRSQAKADSMSPITNNYVIADINLPTTLKDICNGYDTIISALGKSVSLNDKSKESFNDVDFWGNVAILKEAQKSGVKKFVYVSAFQSEKYHELEYFKVHHLFSERLKQSGINYSIVKPPAIFSAFLDMIDMARKGKLVTIGKGDKTTNPIYEGDLAKVCVDAVKATNAEIEAGGTHIYTRKQLNEIIQQAVDPTKKIRNLSLLLFKMALPIMSIVNKNSYHKFSFFAKVLQHNLIAPKMGTLKFEDYIAHKVATSASAAFPG